MIDTEAMAEATRPQPKRIEKLKTLRFSETWPWLLIMSISIFCILAEAMGLFHQGLGVYLYLITCAVVGIFGFIGFIGHVSGEVRTLEDTLKSSNLVAATEGFYAEMEEKRPDYENHWQIVSRMARMTGEAMGVKEDRLETLTRAAHVMDIGMLDIMDEIGREPADGNIKNIIKKHPLYSEEILASIYPDWSILPMVRYHHERFDGTGYPDGLKGNEIPLGARILTVSDAFAAMLSDRPYTKKRTISETVDELNRNSGSQFDPEVVNVVTSLVDLEKDGIDNVDKVLEV